MEISKGDLCLAQATQQTQLKVTFVPVGVQKVAQADLIHHQQL